jgi:hypothetical protein
MKTAKLILFSLAISFCLACATSITDRKILGGQFEIGQNAPTALVPGDTYKVSVEFAIQGEDEPVNNVYWKELSIFNLGRKTILPGPFRIRMPDFDFSLLEDPLYVISLEVANNPFDPMIKKYDIRWALSDRFRFSGRSGKSSGWAERGTHGSPGPMIDVEVAYYDVTGTSLEGTGVYLLINVPQFDRYALVNQNQGPFRVESRGGQGGAGEDGDNNYATSYEPEVYGEDGRDGYDGGIGGVINLRYPSGAGNWRSFFDLRVPGGEGGAGGQGGRGDKLETGEGLIGFMEAVGGVNHGQSGRPGRRGPDGRIDDFSADLNSMFLNIDDPFFERSRLSSSLPVILME